MPSPFIVSPEQIMQEKDELARKGVQMGREVVALQYENGLVFVAENVSATLYKISEIYDRIAFAGVGNYQEYDPLRIVGIEQAEVKGYTYSREDVTARWLANLYSQVIGNVWRQFDMKPLEVELLVAEVGEPNDGFDHRLYRISYSGQVADDRNFSVIGGKSGEIRRWLEEHFRPNLPLDEAIRLAVRALESVRDREAEGPLTAERLEVAVLDVTRGRRKFRRIPREELTERLSTPPAPSE
ncbi:MAG: proteasome subunit alpha [Candidatus Poribacteria bacterium]|nr:MAG: proteasome subunit alpha [Candidatus Poribacteria bacterium]